MSVKEQIRQYVAENFLFSSNGFDMGDDASFLEEGVVDSTGVLELVLFVEETYSFAVADEEELRPLQSSLHGNGKAARPFWHALRESRACDPGSER